MQTVRSADQNGEPAWDRAAERPWHFLQTAGWGRHKESFGWRAVTIPGSGLAPGLPDILTLTRPLPAGVLLTYVPYAPAVAPRSGALPGPGLDALADVVGRATAVIRDRVGLVLGRAPTLVRFDLPQTGSAADLDAAFRAVGRTAGVSKAPIDVQPPDTVLLDLSPGEDELLAAMHRKNRYNVRLAGRKGVRVVQVSDRQIAAGALSSWYRLYRQTATRDRITIHAQAYYERLFAVAAVEGTPDLRLYLASHDEELLAGIIVVHYGDGATYLYGASSDRKRNLMPNYALQWHAISEAKRLGCAWFDFFGIPPADDPAHPMHGLYRFKTGFGGEVVHRLGCWDLAFTSVRGRLFRLAERARDVYVHRVRHHVAR